MLEAPDAQSVTADPSAPEPVVTAATDLPEPPQTPEAPTEEAPPKTFTQEELDAAIGKRLAKEQRKWQRENQPAPPPQPADPYADPDLEAEVELRVSERIAQREAQEEARRIMDAYMDRADEAREKYDDFDTVVNDRVPISEIMADAIRTSDIGPEIAYHLGQNVTEARRISRLSPILQAKEIGRLEAKLADAPPVARKPSSAPAPITPVASRGTAPSFDTNDPRAINSMTAEQWIEADRQRQMKKLKGS